MSNIKHFRHQDLPSMATFQDDMLISWYHVANSWLKAMGKSVMLSCTHSLAYWFQMSGKISIMSKKNQLLEVLAKSWTCMSQNKKEKGLEIEITFPEDVRIYISQVICPVLSWHLHFTLTTTKPGETASD